MTPGQILSVELKQTTEEDRGETFDEFCKKKLLELKERYEIPPFMSTMLQLFLGEQLYDIEKSQGKEPDFFLPNLHQKQIKNHIRKVHSPAPEESAEKLILEYEQ